MGWITEVLFLAGERKGLLSSPMHRHWLWDPPSLQSNEYWDLSLGVKWPVCKADHSPPASVKVKKAWNFHSPNMSSKHSA